jgi:hypothetical protein
MRSVVLLHEATWRGLPRSIVPDACPASWRRLCSVGPRLNQAEVLFEQPLGSEELSFGFVVGSFASRSAVCDFAVIKA